MQVTYRSGTRALVKAILILLCMAQTNSFAQTKKQRAEELMRAYHSYNMFDGAVLVAENGQVVYKAAFGDANREWNIPNTTATKFMLGSVSKPLTAILTVIQVQKGKISLDKTIADYLPAFSKKNGSRITIRQLLSHSSGMPNYEITPDFFPRISRTNYSREDYIRLYMDSALLFTPGTNYSYSSWGYFTLGYILEVVSGKSYDQLMKEDIFDRIGMTGSGSYHHKQIVANRATGYDYALGGFTSADFRDQSNTMGTGDLYSTVEDLFKLHLALSDNSLLNEKLTAEMFTPGIRPWQYGFGWFNQKFRYTPTDSVFANYHLGTTEGFLAFFIRVPSTNSLVVFLCNSAPTHFFGIASNLLRILHDKPVSLKKPVHKALEKIIVSSGVTTAIDSFEVFRTDTANYYVDWLAMDQLGQQLYELKRYEEALQIFLRNAKEFPTRDYVMMSVAKTYVVLGNREKAIEYFQKAVSLNPGNTEAASRLRAYR